MRFRVNNYYIIITIGVVLITLLFGTIGHSIVFKDLFALRSSRDAFALQCASSSYKGVRDVVCSSPLASRNEYEADQDLSNQEKNILHADITDQRCPKYILSVQNPWGGIGHRLLNWVTGALLSHYFDLTMVHEPFEKGLGVHGTYPSYFDRFLGLGVGIPLRADVESIPNIKIVQIPSLQNLWKWPDVKEVMHPYIRNASTAECNSAGTLFIIRQDAMALDPLPLTRNLMVSRFRTAINTNQAWLEKEFPLVWDANPLLTNRVHIVAHIRIGDDYPTPPRVHAGILAKYIIPELNRYNLDYSIHVCAENGDGNNFTVLRDLPTPGGVLFFHPLLSPFETFYHITMADIVIPSASSFSYFAKHISYRPLTFCVPYHRGQDFCRDDSDIVCSNEPDCGHLAFARVRKTLQRLKLHKVCSSVKNNNNV